MSAETFEEILAVILSARRQALHMKIDAALREWARRADRDAKIGTIPDPTRCSERVVGHLDELRILADR